MEHLLSLPDIKDENGPDGIPALILAIGQLDHDLVHLLANPEISNVQPDLLCQIIGELGHAIKSEISDSKKQKMKSVQSVLSKSNIHKLCRNDKHGCYSTESLNDEL